MDLNKDCVSNSITGTSTSSISNWSYLSNGYYYTGMTLLDKYYKVSQKSARSGDLPVGAQRDILKLISNKKEVKLQFSIDYLTIDFEDSPAIPVCHVVVKEVLYSCWSTPTITTYTNNPQPIEITCNTAQTGVTCDCEKNSSFAIDTSGQMAMQL